MTNLLFMTHEFSKPWMKKELITKILAHHRVLLVMLSFNEEEMNEEIYEQLYNKEKGSYSLSLIHEFNQFGIQKDQIDVFHYYEVLHQKQTVSFDDYDILYFPGGYPEQMMKRIIQLGFVEELKTFSKIVMGSSAGAMIQLGTYFISPDYFYKQYSIETGLGYIKNFAIEAHFSNQASQIRCIDQFIHDYGFPVYGIADDGLLICENQQVTTYGHVERFQKKMR